MTDNQILAALRARCAGIPSSVIAKKLDLNKQTVERATRLVADADNFHPDPKATNDTYKKAYPWRRK